MRSNRHQLNTDKTELLWCTAARRLHQLPTTAIRIGLDQIEPSHSVRTLGIQTDLDLTMRSHVQNIVSGCFAVLRQLRSVRRSVSTAVYQTLVTALVLPKLDHGNSTLAGLPVCQLNRQQPVLNAAARSLAGLRRSDHVSNAIASFHWLLVPERIGFKIAVLTFRALHRTSPRYLSDDLRRIADIPCRGRLRSTATNQLDIHPARLNTGERAFASAGPRIWNLLSNDIINCQSLPVFRRKLKAHLFKLSYPENY
jgi:hypothetical protein